MENVVLADVTTTSNNDGVKSDVDNVFDAVESQGETNKDDIRITKANVPKQRNKSVYDKILHEDIDDSHLATSEIYNQFFASGRDYESAFVNHKYTEQEKEELQKYDSLDYLPPWSDAYKEWLRQQPRRLDWDRWVMMGLIGFTVGFVGFLLHQFIDLISNTKWQTATILLEQGLGVAWIFSLGYSLAFLLPGVALVVWYRPSAAGSGIPELIGFLNGTIIRHIFNIRTMVVKFVSCVCAVGAGMPVGPEGPMIHLGGLIGAGLSQFKSDSLNIRPQYFQRFRNSEDRRNFISAGVAAGVASAFGAPVGGLLFSMEEVSSFWNMKLSWQTFFCCMVATITTDLFNSAFSAFSYQNTFGLFTAEANILFQVDSTLSTNIIAFLPSAILGCLGGILGALFTFLNLKIARARRVLLSKIQTVWKKKVLRCVEPCIILLLMVTISTLLPAAFHCTKYQCYEESKQQSTIISSEHPECLTVTLDDNIPPRTEDSVERYTCSKGYYWEAEDVTVSNKSYNEVATLLFVTGEQAIRHLFSRGTHHEFSIPSLITVLVFYYFLACWAAGTSMSSGLVVPMLLIGGLYGRIIGQAMVNWFGIKNPYDDNDLYWAWIDPGAFALIGAASFFGGVSRLTMSLTVIMMEITNDITFLLPLMTAIMFAKWIGDYFTHPFYHANLELKCIPFLDSEPVVYMDGTKLLNLELFSAKDVMTKSVKTLTPVEPVEHVCHLLLETEHGGFPVCKPPMSNSSGAPVYYGIITRLELLMLLQNSDIFVNTSKEIAADNRGVKSQLDYQKVHIDRLLNGKQVYQVLEKYLKDGNMADMSIDLTPYLNRSCPTIPDTFSLHRTYIIFRTLGLRHLPAVNETNEVVGIITRKDLMGFKLEERLNHIAEHDREEAAYLSNTSTA
uniref:chloride transport protein 6-like n=1 Tax=Styela clava TaxID=7725 RepID=UPI00193AD2FE|nr:chloride transport protein 6-like [Styela clava]